MKDIRIIFSGILGHLSVLVIPQYYLIFFILVIPNRDALYCKGCRRVLSRFSSLNNRYYHVDYSRSLYLCPHCVQSHLQPPQRCSGGQAVGLKPRRPAAMALATPGQHRSPGGQWCSGLLRVHAYGVTGLQSHTADCVQAYGSPRHPPPAGAPLECT